MMNLVRTTATAGRVLAQIRHDRRTVILLLFMPSILIGLVAWMFTNTDVFDRIGPAILALFPFTVMFLVTSIATLRERRSGTLERLLATPMAKADFILGYGLAFGILAIAQTLITTGFAVYWCGLNIAGPFWIFVLFAMSDGLLGTALGLLASGFARTEFQVVQFMPAFVFPQFLLGGIIVPRSELPRVLEVIGDWLPLSYAIDALNAVATASETAQYLWARAGLIAMWTIGSLLLGAVTLQRRTP